MAIFASKLSCIWCDFVYIFLLSCVHTWYTFRRHASHKRVEQYSTTVMKNKKKWVTHALPLFRALSRSGVDDSWSGVYMRARANYSALQVTSCPWQVPVVVTVYLLCSPVTQEALSNGTIGRAPSTVREKRITFQHWVEADKAQEFTINVGDYPTGCDGTNVHVPAATVESAFPLGIPIKLKSCKFGSKYELLPSSVHPTPSRNGDVFILPAIGGTYDVKSSRLRGPRPFRGRVESHSHSDRVGDNPKWRFGTPFRDSNIRYFKTSRANTPNFLCDDVFEHLMYGVWRLRMKALALDDFKRARHGFRKSLMGFTVVRSNSGDIPAQEFSDGCGGDLERAVPSSERSGLSVDGEWTTRTIPISGDDVCESTDEDSDDESSDEETDYGTVHRVPEDRFVLIHLTRPGNRKQTTNNRHHEYVRRVVPRKEDLQRIAVQVTKKIFELTHQHMVEAASGYTSPDMTSSFGVVLG